jgi:menaquinone-dependent protoporphyrinogen oxidase
MNSRGDSHKKGTTMSSSSLVLVGYATQYGSTQEVAEAVAAALRETGLEVDLQLLKKVKSLDTYQAVVIGAPLFMFQWHNDAKSFLSRHRQALAERPVAVFALGPVHDPHDDQEWQSSHDQLDKELAKFPWFTPVALEMFGGKYDPSKLRFPIKQLAGDAPPTDIRDWDAIRAWAAGLKPILAA